VRAFLSVGVFEVHEGKKGDEESKIPRVLQKGHFIHPSNQT